MAQDIKEIAKELLAQLQIDCTVEAAQGEDGVVNVNVATQESGLLIGYHGETLASFQLILGLMVYKKLGQWTKVVVEIGDYRAKREEQLRTMAQSYGQQVAASGQPLTLPYLPPAERRVIHLALQDSADVTCESEGEGNERRIVIKPTRN
ncbi:MAG: KH domain-containing protein [Patescibacteria group bacterium]|nr:KH domain-containing protein [Patescibacteria group bacterium]MCL5431659.1 KH domain-containing protein [Patescibacteria group bacterium]